MVQHHELVVEQAGLHWETTSPFMILECKMQSRLGNSSSMSTNCDTGQAPPKGIRERGARALALLHRLGDDSEP